MFFVVSVFLDLWFFRTWIYSILMTINHTAEFKLVEVAVYVENFRLRTQELPLEVIPRLYNEIFNQNSDIVFSVLLNRLKFSHVTRPQFSLNPMAGSLYTSA